VASVVELLPVSRAHALLRTLQMVSCRWGIGLNYAANERILVGKRRIATLDSSTCKACIALHGTWLGLDEEVHNHHYGRCVAVRGLEYLSDVMTGEEWFAGLSEEDQRALAGPAALELIRSGKATLRDFVEVVHDPVFGWMVRERSVRKVKAMLVGE
jgi:hypothetical protein